MLNPKEKKDVVFLQEYLENYPAKMGASANIMKKLFNLFQTCTGKRVYSTEIMILKQERSLKISFQMTCTFKLKRKYSEMAKEI